MNNDNKFTVIKRRFDEDNFNKHLSIIQSKF